MADKSKSIKNASDKELDELIVRIRKENELQCLIKDLKIRSDFFNTPYENVKVSTEEPIDSLYHFGILGMKWGVRRSGGVERFGRRRKMRGGKISGDHQKKIGLKRKKLSAMTNEELKALNTRMQLEKQYKELTKADVSFGRKIVNDIIAPAAKQTATNFVSKAMTKGVDMALEKAFK